MGSKRSKVEVYCIYISGLSPDVQSDDLKDEFKEFGRNIQNIQLHQCSALISYALQMSAILAIANGNNREIKGSQIQVQWADGWPKNRVDRKDFHSVLEELSKNAQYNACTVHCCGLRNKTTINMLEIIFSPFGSIQEIYTNARCSDVLVRFRSKEEATLAICTIDGIEVGGGVLCCGWSAIPSDQLPEFNWKGTGFKSKGCRIEGPFLPPRFPPSKNTSCKPPTEVQKNRLSNSIDEILRNTSGAFIGPSTTDEIFDGPDPDGISAAPESIGFNSSMSKVRIPDIGNMQGSQDFGKSDPEWPQNIPSNLISRSDNVTTPTTPSSTKETHNESDTTSVLSNEQYTNDDFDKVFNKTSLNNCTVYCGGLNLNATYESLKKVFSEFGEIEEIDLYADKTDYALISFTTKLAATLAICSIHNTEINGSLVKCIWSNRPTNQKHQSQENSTPPPVLPEAKEKQLPSQPDLLQDLEKKDKPGDEDKVEEKPSEMLCKICDEELMCVLFLPCRHLKCCGKCAHLMSECPWCKQKIITQLDIYLG